MATTEKNLKDTEAFIRYIMQKNFQQEVTSDDLRAAAKKLRDALPQRRKEKKAA